jgi:hypothetical protein
LSASVAFLGQLPRAHGQDVAHSSMDHSKLAVVVSGATTPDLIPDDLAYAHFISGLAIPEKPSPQDIGLRDALLSPVGLSTQDTAAFIGALRGVRTQLDFLARETQRLSATPEVSHARLIDLKLHRTRALSEAHSRVLRTLSRDGRQRLAAFIKAEVKPRITVYGDPVQ